MTPSEQKALEELKAELQSEQHPAKTFESLVAALIGKLLGVSVAVAKSGFQHGADAGIAGRQERSLRIECKRYTDSRSLNDRELLGEVEQALQQDPALEVWILAATREVPEQLENALQSKAERDALPIVVIDWKSPGPPLLAALCTSDPETVEQLYSKNAADLAREVTNVCASQLTSLKADLQAWALGFTTIRRLAAERLTRIWNNPRSALALMHQNVAGGAAIMVRREGVANGLSMWWRDADRNLALNIGSEGVGKTWAVLDWMIERLDDLPIVLLLPASAAAAVRDGGGSGAMRLLGEQLYEATGYVRSASYWEARARRLLKRPKDEGPVVLLIIDGLNQQPDVPWQRLFATFQDDPFSPRVRVIGTVRRTYFVDRINGLRRLLDRPAEIELGPFNDAELDQRLASAGIRRERLSDELLQLARIPLLFDLVAKYHSAQDLGEITLHRLLWEYGRDEKGKRQSRSFSEDEWRTWLAGLAQRFRDGLTELTRNDLAASVARADFSPDDVKARLDDIVDGQLTEAGLSGRSRFKPEAVAHALALELLDLVQSTAQRSRNEVSEKLEEWLDPISGLDQRAEILRAAVSILVAQRTPADDLTLSVLLTAWLTTQNLAEPHRREIIGMAGPLRLALLDAVEQTSGYNQSGARLNAVNALRAIPRNDHEARTVIVDRAARWLSVTSMGRGHDRDGKLAKRFETRVGTCAAGEVVVLGHRMCLVTDNHDEALQMLVAPLLEGFPLAPAVSVFETVAIAHAIRGLLEPWMGLKWLCLLNDNDEEATAAALRERSAAFLCLTAEPAVNSMLPALVASLLLYLTGHDGDEQLAKQLDPGIDRIFTYENNYLRRPAASFYPLERRHAADALCDTQVHLLNRIQHAEDFLLDPDFELPRDFVAEVVATADKFDLSEVDSHGSRTRGDHQFASLLPAVARCSPASLARLLRRKLRDRPPAETRYWRAIHAPSALLLTEAEDAQAAHDLRMSPDAHPDTSSETWARTCLLLLELVGKPGAEQAQLILAADLKYIHDDLLSVLEPMMIEEAEALLAQHGDDTTSERAGVLINLLFNAPVAESGKLWTWLQDASDQAGHPHRGLLFQLLTEKDSRKFGAHLDSTNWSWSADEENVFVSDYGSQALVAATAAMPIEQLLTRLAPWRIAWAARRRGADPAEVRLAAEVLGRSILNVSVLSEIPGVLLTVDLSRDASGDDSITRLNDVILSADEDLSRRLIVEADHQRVVEVAIARINEARARGASLYLSQGDVADMKELVTHAPRDIEAWLEGLDSDARAFRSRILSAEGLYLALCEALLELRPQLGQQLWRVLSQAMRMRYLGRGRVDERVNMLFRVPDSAPVIELRRELLDLCRASTDLQLFDVAFAAMAAGRRDWLDTAIGQDSRATEPWRRMRAIVLSGFVVSDGSPETDAWPAGEVRTRAQGSKQAAARSRVRDSFARHWWGVFLRAENQADAYAAWLLFMTAANRRAYIWMSSDREAVSTATPLQKLKEVQVEANNQDLRRAIERREEKLPKQFLSYPTVNGVGPWGKGPN